MWAAPLAAAGFDGGREGVRLVSFLPPGIRAGCLVRAAVLLAVLLPLSQFCTRLLTSITHWATWLLINHLPVSEGSAMTSSPQMWVVPLSHSDAHAFEAGGKEPSLRPRSCGCISSSVLPRCGVPAHCAVPSRLRSRAAD